jgi:hypothetical protein
MELEMHREPMILRMIPFSKETIAAAVGRELSSAGFARGAVRGGFTSSLHGGKLPDWSIVQPITARSVSTRLLRRRSCGNAEQCGNRETTGK